MSLNEPLYRDLTYLTGEVYHNTHVDCISIQQVISQEFYTQVFMEVKTRIINLLCFYEEAGIKIDKVDIALIVKKFPKKIKSYIRLLLLKEKHILLKIVLIILFGDF